MAQPTLSKKVAGTLEIYGDLQSGGGSASTDTPEGGTCDMAWLSNK